MKRINSIRNIRSKLENGNTSIGSWMQIANASVAEIMGNSDYDLSAYQINEIDRQICSAPNQVELGFYISEYFEGDGILTQTDGYGISKFEGYKFLEPRFYFSRKHRNDEKNRNDWDGIKRFYKKETYKGYPFSNCNIDKWGFEYL